MHSVSRFRWPFFLPVFHQSFLYLFIRQRTNLMKPLCLRSKGQVAVACLSNYWQLTRLKQRVNWILFCGKMGEYFSGIVRGVVASWLVRSSPDRAVRVLGLAGDIVMFLGEAWSLKKTSKKTLKLFNVHPCVHSTGEGGRGWGLRAKR